MPEIEQYFNNGMSKDQEISLQKEGTYNDALNMRLLSNDNNTFSLETIKGNLNILNNPVFGNPHKLNPNYQVIGWTAGVNKVIVFSTNAPSDPTPPTNPDGTYSDGNGEIGVLTINEQNVGTYTTVYNHKDLNFSTSFQIEAKLFSENIHIERVYWTDNHNPPRSLNIANPALYRYYTNVEVNAMIGQSFMVLRGSVTLNLVTFYGPNVSYPSPSETVFVSDGTAGFSADARVILYAANGSEDGAPSVETIDSTPEKELGNIRYAGWQGNAGELICGMYQYAYQLQTSDGALSTWSYVTTPTPLVFNYPSNTISSYQGYTGDNSTRVTTKAINVLIEGIDTTYSKIRVAAIHAISLTATDLPVLFFDGDITGETMTVVHRGGENIAILTFDDLKQILVAFKTVKTLDIIKNRLFYGNITTASQFDFDPSGATVRTIEYLVPSDRVGYPTDVDYGTSGLNGHAQLQTSSNPVIYTDQWYQVSGGNATYDGVEYGINFPATTPYFKGVPLIHNISGSTGAGTFKATKTIDQPHVLNVESLILFENDSTGGNYDDGGNYNPALGRYTAPSNITLKFTGSIIVETSAGGGAHVIRIYMLKNNATILVENAVQSQAQGTTVTHTLDSGFINLLAGDFVDIRTSPLSNDTTVKIDSVFQNVAPPDPSVLLTPVIRIQKYTGVYDYIAVENDWADTKGMAVSTFLRSYWRGETYRFGVLVWDKLGNPTFVRWLNDKEIPQQYDIDEPNFSPATPLGFDPKLAEQYADYDTSLRHLGIRVDNLDLGQIAVSLGVPLNELHNHIDGFSIVRAKRDPQVYAQGIMLETVIDGDDTLCTGSTYRLNNLHQFQRPNVFTIYAPDIQFGYLNRNTTINITTDFLRTVDIRFDTTTSGAGLGSFGFEETVHGHHYEKYYKSVVGNTAPGIRDKGSSNTFTFATTCSVGASPSGIVLPGIPAGQFRNVASTDLGGGDTRLTRGALTLVSSLASVDIVGDTNFRNKPIVNFIRPNNNLYGGTSDASKANTQYIYCGHYQKMDSDFMTYLVGNAGIVNGIEVFGGDCYVSIYDLARQITEHSDSDEAHRISFGMLFPIESDMNTFLREGNRHLSWKGSRDNTTTNASGISYDPSQPEEFIYNATFSYEELNVLYAGLPVNFIPNDKFGYRVWYSNQKVNGEFFDSFKIFLANNFRDVEGWAGDITNLRSKDGKLFYWQNHAFGYLPVNERITVSGGGGLGTPTTIGEGGVLTRFDELKRYYGNQHQWSLCETENSFAWFDMRRRALCHASLDGNIIELSTAKGLIAFFVNNVHGNVVVYDNPVNKKGITAVYDSRFREILMTFKGIGDPSDIENVDTHFTVGFNNLYKYFSGFYSFVPGNMIEFNNRFISNFEGFTSAIIGSHAYVVGDIVTQNDDNYVNILAYISAGIPIVPSSDTTHWSKANSSDELYMHNIGDIAKFYGIVRDNYVRLVINAKRSIPKAFDNHEWLGMDNGFFFTDYIANTLDQTASDLGIIVSKRGEYSTDYACIINSTVPMSSITGRLISNWAQILMRKDNKLNGSIITSSNELIKFVSLKTTFRQAY